MPSKNQYDLVQDNGYDSRIPLHNDDAFQHGIVFQAKYIGTLDVPRPSSRVEIVAAMRRIRYEFKAKAIKKKKVDITVSMDGVKIVMHRTKPKVPLPFTNKNKDDWAWDENRLLVMSHPIYRIFYVSHDSQDLKIFSYIARDGSTNVFKCNVFKAHKKSEAMRLVRTIGQAFEVCHKMSINNAQQEAAESNADNQPVATDNEEDASLPKQSTDQGGVSDTTSIDKASTSTQAQSPMEAFQEAQQILQHVGPNTLPMQAMGALSQPTSPQLVEAPGTYVINGDEPLPMTARHRIDYLRHQVEQQQQQTQVALAHVAFVKDQLTAETAARVQAQARAHNLLVQNRELLAHINALVGQLQELEARLTGTDLEQFNLLKSPVQQMPLPEATLPAPGPTYIPAITELDLSTISSLQNSTNIDHSNIKFMQQMESPDSGHREMSSDSLVYSVIPNDVTLGHTPGNSIYGATPVLLPGGNMSNYSNMVNGNMIAVAEPGFEDRFKVIDSAHSASFGYQKSAQNEDRINGNPFISRANGSVVGTNPMANSFRNESDKSDKENNNKTNISISSQVTSGFNSNTKLGQRSNQGQTNSTRKPTDNSTIAESAVIGNKSFTEQTGDAYTISSSTTSTRSASALDTKELSQHNKEVDKAKKDGILKTLNLNLKSLSPHKRHSSTSAEIYSSRKDNTMNDDAKVAIQSSSESKLLRYKNAKDDKKQSVFAVTAVKS